ncbi:MAG: class II aldolase [Bacteroidetes bacterium]|nr:class II aldolase [Bacteroidota bacterium]
MNLLTELISLSRRYGANPEFVLAGGGNTSLKDENVLYVKASGHTLAAIDRQGFVAMDQQKLQAVWVKEYPADPDQRENAVLADMMNARLDGETARPSVEALLHSLLPQKYVVHLHPALVNGLTCAVKGEEYADKIFGKRALWIPLVNPGYILAKTVRDKLLKYKGQFGVAPEFILLQNHGIFVGADTPESIDTIYDSVMGTLQQQLIRKPEKGDLSIIADRRLAIEESLSSLAGNTSREIYSCSSKELALRLRDWNNFIPVSSAFTPDHIVYSGFKPLWVPESVFSGDVKQEIHALVEDFRDQHNCEPKTIAVQNTGIFTYNENALVLFLDTVQVAAYTESFGGYLYMTDEQIDFIRTWEVEKYRAEVLKSK